MGFSVLGSFVGAINPVFLFTVAILVWMLVTQDKTPVFDNIESIVFWLPVQFAVVAVFPLTTAIISVQKKVFESDIVYFKQYPKEYWNSLKSTFLRSSLLLLIYGAASFLITFAANYYVRLFTIPALQFGVVILLFWVYLFIIMMQYVILPIMIYNPEFSLKDTIKYAFRFVMAEGLTIFAIVLIDFIVFLFCTVSIVFTLIFYIGLSSSLRIHLHKAIVKKYTPKEDKENEPTSFDSERDAWATIMSKSREAEKEENKKD